MLYIPKESYNSKIDVQGNFKFEKFYIGIWIFYIFKLLLEILKRVFKLFEF